MENASKALVIAGSMLIALIVISLLVIFFNSLRENMAVEQKEESILQATEFNKKFDSYERDVYGSELLSLANKVYDYNVREADEKGYTEVKLIIKIDGTKLDSTKTYFKSSEYTITKENLLKTEIDKISTYLKTFDSIRYSNPSGRWSRSIPQLAKMRTNDWVAGLELNITKTNDRNKYDEINNYISDYNQYKNIESQLKQSTFVFKGSEYDKNTGRIKILRYELK